MRRGPKDASDVDDVNATCSLADDPTIDIHHPIIFPLPQVIPLVGILQGFFGRVLGYPEEFFGIFEHADKDPK